MKKPFFLLACSAVMLSSCGFGRYDYINSSSSASSLLSSTVLSSASSLNLKEEVLKEDGLHDSRLFYCGRHLYDDSQKSEMLYYTAAGAEFSFKGTKAVLSFSYQKTAGSSTSGQDIYFSYILDNEDELAAKTFIVSTASLEFTLDNLAYASHHLKIVKRSEPQDALVGLKQVAVLGSIETSAVAYPYSFLCIGASGISGHGALGAPNTPRTTANSSSMHSFGYLTSYLFSGQTEFVSNSGWGLKWGYNATNANGSVNIQTAFDSYGIKDDESLVQTSYPLTNSKPDFVIVNIGGNDYTSYIQTLSDQTAQNNAIAVFKDNVKAFVQKIHASYPQAFILWTSTNETSGNGLAARQALDEIDSANAFSKTILIYAKGTNGDAEGADGHASFATHKRSAQAIADYLVSAKGLKNTRSF